MSYFLVAHGLFEVHLNKSTSLNVLGFPLGPEKLGVLTVAKLHYSCMLQSWIQFNWRSIFIHSQQLDSLAMLHFIRKPRSFSNNLFYVILNIGVDLSLNCWILIWIWDITSLVKTNEFIKLSYNGVNFTIFRLGLGHWVSHPLAAYIFL